MHSTQTKNEQETIDFGIGIGEKAFAGMLILLFGDLGSGKTQLAKGIAKGMDINDTVSSPTYTILFEHSGRLPMYHFDLYRITGDDDFFEIGGYEYLAKGGVCVIEWPERINWDDQDRLEVHINIVDDNTRSMELKAFGQKYADWLDKL